MLEMILCHAAHPVADLEWTTPCGCFWRGHSFAKEVDKPGQHHISISRACVCYRRGYDAAGGTF